MGAAVPQVITSDRASNNQFIDGSVLFDKGKSQHLKKTFSSAGNRDVWTWGLKSGVERRPEDDGSSHLD